MQKFFITILFETSITFSAPVPGLTLAKNSKELRNVAFWEKVRMINYTSYFIQQISRQKSMNYFSASINIMTSQISFYV